MFASNLLHRHTCFLSIPVYTPKKRKDLKLKRQYWHWLSLAMQLNDGVTAFSHACDKNPDFKLFSATSFNDQFFCWMLSFIELSHEKLHWECMNLLRYVTLKIKEIEKYYKFNKMPCFKSTCFSLHITFHIKIFAHPQRDRMKNYNLIVSEISNFFTDFAIYFSHKLNFFSCPRCKSSHK